MEGESAERAAALFEALQKVHRTQMGAMGRMAAAGRVRSCNAPAALEIIATGGKSPCGPDGPRPPRAEDAVQGGVIVSELARALHMTMPATSRLLGMMEKNGLVRRAPDQDDRRKTRVTLTSAGEEKRRADLALMQEYSQLVAEDFGAERLRALIAELDGLSDSLKRSSARMEGAHPGMAVADTVDKNPEQPCHGGPFDGGFPGPGIPFGPPDSVCPACDAHDDAREAVARDEVSHPHLGKEA